MCDKRAKYFCEMKLSSFMFYDRVKLMEGSSSVEIWNKIDLEASNHIKQTEDRNNTELKQT